MISSKGGVNVNEKGDLGTLLCARLKVESHSPTNKRTLTNLE